MTVKVIFPKDKIVDPKAMEKAIKNAMTGAAKGAQADFYVTTQTWQHQVDFKIDKPDDYTREVSTDDEIYGYVNDGTEPHIIVPRNKKILFMPPKGSYKAKTTPRAIKSSAGRSAEQSVFALKVRHPGTDAREFDDVIQEKWDKRLPEIVQRAIDAVVRGNNG